MWRAWAVAIVFAACSDRAAPSPASPAPPVVAAPVAPDAPAATSQDAGPVDSRCGGTLSPRRETLAKGVTKEIAAGVQATYRGAVIDHYDDGTSATILTIEVAEAKWMPDIRDHEFHAIGDHCVRLVVDGTDRVELDVALQPEKQYDPARCKMSCCETEESRRPAPDGTVECCFCSDRPRR